MPWDYSDTIFLQEIVSDLPELVVETRRQRLLHILAYVREVSTLTTYTDTVYLFREKMVDYMLRPDDNVKFKGWINPRTLTCRSYYRFSNSSGLDSVSDACNYHFSWTDWLSVPPPTKLPIALRGKPVASDTLHGKYSLAEVWTKDIDRAKVSVNVLADRSARRWIPELNPFFNRDIDFDCLKIDYDFDNVTSDSISPIELSHYSFLIDSGGRGRDMFRFGKRDQQFFVNTAADVYILDREYISVKEAKQWEARKFDLEEIGIYEPVDAPPLSEDLLALVERVNHVDKDQVRLDADADKRMISNKLGRRNFKIGNRVLLMLKGLTGISAYKSGKKRKSEWREFRNECKRMAASSNSDE